MAWEKFENIKGPKGDRGPAGAIGSVSAATGPAGSTAEARMSGPQDSPHVAFTIPKGDKGDKGDRGPAGALASASAVSVPAEAPAEVVLTGTDEVKHARFYIPRGLPGTDAIPTAEAVGAYLAAVDSPAQEGFRAGAAASISGDSVVRDAVDARIAASAARRTQVNVMDFGAVGDGVTDDWQAFTDAIAALDAAGGGTLVLPAGKTFWCKKRVTIIDNLVIDGYGATLVRRYGAGEEGYAVFRSKPSAGPGYGAGGRNFVARGLRFVGSFVPGAVRDACGFALHHVEDALIEDCVFEETQVNGHCIDMMGCRRVTVRNTTLLGAIRGTGNYQRIEAIQIGSSISGSESAPDDPSDFDGLPCVNITIDGVTAQPLARDYGVFPAPNVCGSHDGTKPAGPDRGITVRHVRVTDPIQDTASTTPGVIKFVGVADLLVEDVIVDISEPADIRIISAYHTDTAPCGDVTIRDVTVRGLSAASNRHTMFVGAEITATVPYEGKVRISDISLTAVSGTSATNAIVLRGGKIEVRDLEVVGALRMLSVSSVKTLRVAGATGDGTRADSIYVSGAEYVSIENSVFNTAASAQPVSLLSVQHAHVAGSSFRTTGAARIVGFNACQRVSCIGNLIDRSSGTAGIQVYSSPEGATGVVSGNVITGGGTNQVAIDAAGVLDVNNSKA